ncbi:hypothetical protein STRTUCAR8_00025 [Streptomyces turgidiscabies Car8]|uniref:Secreted protein n=1 Tax=Streptomyces turgidiscabies (strain Car8) TaxID=698760 RepID=L7FD94_STRT8|nr:hypothetical protein STRTUCAR8_00025 [Streptomyces turgidiscabies Car8]
MTRLITTAVVLAATFVGSGAVSAPVEAAPAQRSVAVPASTPCSTWWEVTGKKVAVRRPSWNEGPVATPSSPVHHYLRKGDRVVSCIVAIARTQSGPAYRKCGRDGSAWRVVQGGQVPATCLKRV